MRVIVCMIWLILLGSCSGADPQSQSTDSGEATQRSTAPIENLPQGWNAISPGGETLCSDGSAYRFFVRPGNPQKLMVYLQGGGACWFRENCDPQMQPSYNIRIGDFKPRNTGIFNFANADNPFLDYSIVMAPYCSGDVHLGNQDTTYPPVRAGQEDLVVHHRGRINMQAVLDWTFANVPHPEQIFVTGSSAGAIPSPFYASLVADRYPGAKIAQLGDGAGGYRRINADTRPDEQWGTFSFLNSEPGFEQVDRESFNYEALYIAAARAQPQMVFAEYDAAEDAVQKRFLALAGNETPDLLASLTANHADIRAEVNNFRSFITGGDSHTVLLRPEFYGFAADGKSIRDWVADLAGYRPVNDRTCANCQADEYIGDPMPAPLATLWASWQDQEQQYVAPFQIFDNVYYVGIDWVAAYIIKTSDGLILIDSLYGKWVPQLIRNITALGLNPADIRYIINTHGHFDHAGGSAILQHTYGARVVMTAEDWQLAAAKAENPRFYMPVPAPDIVANDGDAIILGDTRIDLFKTPGHTEGVLTLRYAVHDGSDRYTAITLGGVGLNFSGVERTEAYIRSYERLRELQQGVSVSLPNHAAMGDVFRRAAALATREPGAPHPFVDATAYQASLNTFLANARQKLEAEKTGTAKNPLEELTDAIGSED